MKKVYYLLAMLPLLTCCGSDEPNVTDVPKGEEDKVEQIVVNVGEEDETDLGYFKDDAFYKIVKGLDGTTGVVIASMGEHKEYTVPVSLVLNNKRTYYFKSINYYCYAPSLEVIKLPENYELGSDNTFYSFDQLKRIVVSSANNTIRSIDGILYSKDKKDLLVVPKQYDMQEFVVPDYVTTIGRRAFYYNQKIQSIVIPENVEKIDEPFAETNIETVEVKTGKIKTLSGDMFAHMPKLKRITFADGPTEITGNLFVSDKNLKQVLLPSTLEKINAHLFAYCSSIEELVIPAKVSTMSTGSLDGLSSLARLHFQGATPPKGLNEESFTTSQFKNCVLYIPKGSADAYNIEPFNKFKNIEEE